MPRQRSPNRDKAFEIYKQYNGYISNKKISNMLNEKENTISNWKSRDKWNIECSTTNNECSTTNKKTQIKNEKKVYESLIKSVEENEVLTDKQRLFCMYYVDNFNATQSYLKAYKCDYITAKTNGCRGLTNANILKEIKRLKRLKAESLLIDKNDILERYIHIAFADMNDFVDFGVNEIKTINEQGVEEKYKRNHVNFKDNNVVDGRLICEISVGKNGSKIKLEDRQKALDWLSKYFNMNPMDKHKIEYDNKRFELEQQKINGSESEIADDWVDAIIENNRE